MCEKKIFCVFIAIFCILMAVSCQKRLPTIKNIEIQKSDGSKIYVNSEIASTDEERQHGFMFRKKIPDGTGMLFVFEKDQIMNFWMKNTPHPLSIAYITSDGKIRDIFDMTPYSLSDVTSTGYARYALEVPQGWFKKNNVNVGDVVVLE